MKKEKKNLNDITIIIVTYQSLNKVLKFTKKIPEKIPIIIVDNSKDYVLKKKMSKRNNVQVYLREKNLGYGSSVNYAVKKVKTNYFLAVQCDVEGINKKSLETFFYYAKLLKDKFSMLGPRFIDAPVKGHIQTNKKYDYKKIFCVHGSTLFINKKNFKKINGFDENYFLYWEERDLAKKFDKVGLNCFQINKICVRHKKGESVYTKYNQENIKLNHLYSWHFIWSKYYFFKKNFGQFFSILYFTPIILRVLSRIFITKLFSDNKNKQKYLIRWHGLKTSLLGRKSYIRLDNIKSII